MASRSHSFSAITKEAAYLLGSCIAVARRERHWSVTELAERVGVTRVTVHKIEKGDPTVGLGIAFEAAAVLGIPLFDEDAARRRLEGARNLDRLAVLPARVRKPVKINDDF